jgi:hypothetical protein
MFRDCPRSVVRSRLLRRRGPGEVPAAGTWPRRSRGPLFQEPQQSLTGLAVQFPGVQRSIMIGICGIETLFDHREIFVPREGPIVIGIGSRQLFRKQSARQFPLVERAIMVALQLVERG